MRVNAANYDGYVKTSHRFPQYPMLGLNSRLATCLYGYWTVPFIAVIYYNYVAYFRRLGELA